VQAVGARVPAEPAEVGWLRIHGEEPVLELGPLAADRGGGIDRPAADAGAELEHRQPAARLGDRIEERLPLGSLERRVFPGFTPDKNVMARACAGVRLSGARIK
jgi:hypothetical protein